MLEDEEDDDEFKFNYIDLPKNYMPRKQIIDKTRCFNNLVSTIQNRGGICLSTVNDYENAQSKFTVKCSNDHMFSATYSNLMKERWCPDCRIPTSELVAISCIKYFLDKPFIKVRPDFLKLPTGYALELDGFNNELKLGIEYNGIQHYKFKKFFHNNDINKFFQQQMRDELKLQICESLGIKVIVVPYKLKSLEISNYIHEQLIKLGYNPKKSTFDIKSIKYINDNALKVNDIINSKNGIFVSGNPNMKSDKLTIVCHKNHTFTTKTSKILDDVWCNICSHKRNDPTRAKISATLKKRHKTTEGQKAKEEAFAKRSVTMAKQKEERIANTIEKECRVCKIVLPIEQFSFKKDAGDRKQSDCKKCAMIAKKLRKLRAHNKVTISICEGDTDDTENDIYDDIDLCQQIR